MGCLGFWNFVWAARLGAVPYWNLVGPGIFDPSRSTNRSVCRTQMHRGEEMLSFSLKLSWWWEEKQPQKHTKDSDGDATGMVQKVTCRTQRRAIWKIQNVRQILHNNQKDSEMRPSLGRSPPSFVSLDHISISGRSKEIIYKDELIPALN